MIITNIRKLIYFYYHNTNIILLYYISNIIFPATYIIIYLDKIFNIF